MTPCVLSLGRNMKCSCSIKCWEQMNVMRLQKASYHTDDGQKFASDSRNPFCDQRCTHVALLQLKKSPQPPRFQCSKLNGASTCELLSAEWSLVGGRATPTLKLGAGGGRRDRIVVPSKCLCIYLQTFVRHQLCLG